MYRILIVEDDPIIAKTMEKHIASWGYEVACVTDFNDVLSEFAAFDPQLVLLDISSPSSMATIGAMKSANSLKSRLSSSHPHQIT